MADKLPKHVRETITVRCAVCKQERSAQRIVFGLARWLSLPSGWWLLLDCVGGEPHCRCPECIK